MFTFSIPTTALYGAVSYTHLDVYKRQAQDLILKEALYAEGISSIFPKIPICQGKWRLPM